MLNITWWPRIVQIEILNIISMEFGLVGYWLKYSSSTPTFILMKNIKYLVHHIQSEPSWIQCTYAHWVGDLLESYQTEEAIEESFPAKYYICCCWRQPTSNGFCAEMFWGGSRSPQMVYFWICNIMGWSFDKKRKRPLKHSASLRQGQQFLTWAPENIWQAGSPGQVLLQMVRLHWGEMLSKGVCFS